jgi:hypothetical protein
VAHANAALTPRQRLRLARAVVEDGWTVSYAAAVSGRLPNGNALARRYEQPGPVGKVRPNRPLTWRSAPPIGPEPVACGLISRALVSANRHGTCRSDTSRSVGDDGGRCLRAPVLDPWPTPSGIGRSETLAVARRAFTSLRRHQLYGLLRKGASAASTQASPPLSWCRCPTCAPCMAHRGFPARCRRA